MPALSTIANVCLLLPLACNAVNWKLTTRGNCEALKTDVILRFIALGGVCYAVGSLLKAVLSFPETAVHTNLTVMNIAVQALTLHGFVGSVLFGCAYYLLPRVARVEWAQEKLI